MKALMSVIKATVVGGFLIVLPAVLVFLMLSEAFDIVLVIAEPIADALPIPLDAATEKLLVAIVLMISICLLTGLVALTKVGARLGRWLEKLFLDRMPGYSLIKSLSRSFAGVDSEQRFAPAVVTTALETRMLAFIVEEHENGDVAVFMPSAPTPSSGVVHIVRKEQVRKLDVPMSAVANSFMEFGTGATGLIASGQADSPERQP